MAIQNMKNHVETTFIREAKAYLRPLRIAEHLASRAFQTGAGSADDAQAALVFLAFAIEAFCNHVGLKVADDFDAFDKMCVKEKLKKVAAMTGFDLKMGERPFQTFHDLFKFRDAMAHSRTENVMRKQKIPRPARGMPKATLSPPPTNWEAYCTPSILSQAVNDVNKGLRAIYKTPLLADTSPFEKENWTVKMSCDLEMKKQPPPV